VSDGEGQSGGGVEGTRKQKERQRKAKRETVIRRPVVGVAGLAVAQQQRESSSTGTLPGGADSEGRLDY